ncbi:hypothetical protein F0562_013334 [Nyssa sinensis]|uniref:Uncharacterized protein n=1 Tax=Nyssa sinensis TaxID=561372 RepID=A0A5J4ZN50_9ASTE|nr:hypothetical protein F0562_013334 [Nyssa sinensis]
MKVESSVGEAKHYLYLPETNKGQGWLMMAKAFCKSGLSPLRRRITRNTYRDRVVIRGWPKTSLLVEKGHMGVWEAICVNSKSCKARLEFPDILGVDETTMGRHRLQWARGLVRAFPRSIPTTVKVREGEGNRKSAKLTGGKSMKTIISNKGRVQILKPQKRGTGLMGYGYYGGQRYVNGTHYSGPCNLMIEAFTCKAMDKRMKWVGKCPEGWQRSKGQVLKAIGLGQDSSINPLSHKLNGRLSDEAQLNAQAQEPTQPIKMGHCNTIGVKQLRGSDSTKGDLQYSSRNSSY